MNMSLKKQFAGLALAGCAAFGGNAYAQVVDTYAWGGLCTDCPTTGGDTPASAVLSVQNYTPGDSLSAANFYSFSYVSTGYDISFSATSVDLSGTLPAVGGVVDTFMSVSGLTDSTGTIPGVFSFTTIGDGSWTLALNGSSLDEHGSTTYGHSDEYHDSSHWNFDHHEGNVSAIPEPQTYAMLLAGLGLMGFIARRRKQMEAA